MSRIHVLPEVLANKIAAGEVVERPASVVKELMENAVDAEASRVWVQIRGGGRSFISVIDDGVGMEPDDMFLALERHATSKLASEHDLFHVRSLGFRGEALPSIASVGKMELESRVREMETGQRIRVEGGVIRNVTEVSMQPGTRVSVSNLFFNTPVRRKFLRSVSTETAHVTDMFVRTALPLPRIHFRLDLDGRRHLDFPPTESQTDRLVLLWGREVAGRTMEFSVERDPFEVRGFLVPPDISRTGPRHVYTYVNRRWVRDKLVQKAVLDAVRPYLAKGRYPLCVVFLEVDPSLVDVNVHPTKAEVRFQNPQQVYDLVLSSMRNTLARRTRSALRPPDLQPAPSIPSSYAAGAPPEPGTGAQSPEPGSIPRPSPRMAVAEAAGAASARDLPPSTVSPGLQRVLPRSGAAELPRVVGQLANRYILCESADGLLIVDQHAAHERIQYEKLKQGVLRKRLPRQRLLTPQIVDLPAKEFHKLLELRETLTAAGIELHPFGPMSLVVRELPEPLSRADVPSLLRDLLDGLEDAVRTGAEEDVMHHVLSTMSCHGAIRSGQSLAVAEMEAMIRALMDLDAPHHCPHGRPIFKTVSFHDLEKDLRRR